MSGVLIHGGGGGGEQCSTAKKWGEGQLTTHEIRYNQRKITSIVTFLILIETYLISIMMKWDRA